MAIFRKVHTEFWNDSKILEELTPESKFFFIFLLTNPMTTQIGIYEITKKYMAFHMGYSEESIKVLLDLFENKYELIKYNEKTKEIAIKNWGKYNLNIGGKPAIDCINKELKKVSDKYLIKYVADGILKEDIREIFYSYIGKEKVEPQDDFHRYYEENVEKSNNLAEQWLQDITEVIDFELFKKSIEIARDRKKVNRNYINGIIKQWTDNNIYTIDKLREMEKKSGNYTKQHTKSKYARELEKEDESLYEKPPEEFLEEIRRNYGGKF